MKKKQKKKPFCECHLIECMLECRNCNIFKERKRANNSTKEVNSMWLSVKSPIK